MAKPLNFLHSDITVIILHGQILILYNWRPYLSITPRIYRRTLDLLKTLLGPVMNCCECRKELWGQQQAAYFLIGCTRISASFNLLYAMQIIRVISLVWRFNDEMNIDRLFYAICCINVSQQPHTRGREGSGEKRVMWRLRLLARVAVLFAGRMLTFWGNPLILSSTYILKVHNTRFCDKSLQ